MTQLTTPYMSTAATTTSASSARITRKLLGCGVAAGPLFLGVATLQILTREGFDLRRHAISVLSLGDYGWIQIANFILSGLLTVAFAVGLWRTLHPGRAGTWGPLLIAANGIGLIMGGLFVTDAGAGFPPGAPQAIPDLLSWHAIVHSVAFFLAVLSIVAASFVFLRRFVGLRQWRWAAYCAVTGVGMPAFVIAGMSYLSLVGVLFFVMAVLMCAWVTAMAARLMSETRRRS